MSQSATIVQRLWNYCNVLRDESLEDTANLPEPDLLALEIMEDLQAALEQFAEIVEDLGEE
jgi:type I restriction enzyme M protein